MSSSKRLRWLGCVGLLLCAACSRGPGAEQDPRPSRLVPAEGLSTGPVPVVIEGENFLALVTQQLGGERAVEVNARFEARLGDVALEGVERVDDRHLRAVVPPGLKTGWYALTVVSPLGRDAVVPGAYFAAEHAPARLEARARLERSPVAVGQQLQLVLDVSNVGEAPALGVRPALGVAGSGQVTVVDAPSPADVGPGQGVSFAWTLRADGPGDARLSPSASGVDGTWARPVAASVDPVPLAMRTPAALEARVLVATSALSVGQDVDVSLEVHNTGETVALGVAPECVPSGSASLLSAPQPTDIPGGELRTFVWRYRVDGAGAMAFSLSAEGKESLGGRTLETGPLATPPLTVQRPAALASELLARPTVSVGQVFDVSLRATNTGEAPARAVTPLWDVPPALEVRAAPSPVELTGGESTVLTWSVRAKAPGTVTVAPTLQGTDANSGLSISAPALQGALSVQTEARLSGRVSVTPAQVSAGQGVTLELRVHNDGQAAARDVSVEAPRLSGTAGLTPRSSPPPVSLLAGGAEAVFTWTYDAVAPGQVLLTAGASGSDVNSGASLAMPPVTSAPVTVQTPASLTASLVATPDPVNVGGQVKLSLTVTNGGQALARAVTPSAPLVTGGAGLVTGPTPASLDVAGGASAVFSWDFQTGAEGPLAFRASAAGRDGNSGAAVSAPEAQSAPLTAQRPATLVGTLTVPPRLNVGQSATLLLEVKNTGVSTASAVKPVALGSSGVGSLQDCVAAEPASADLPGGASQTFRCTVTGLTDGSVTFTASATGMDAVDGRAVNMTPVGATFLIQRPALLTATLSAPAQVGVGGPFSVTLQLKNTGGADAVNVAPDALGLSDAAALEVRSGPTAVPVSLPGGGSQRFTWTVLASREGTFRFTGGAHGQDANDAGASLAAGPVTSGDVVAREVQQLAADPFGDGTAFSFVFRYNGRVYLGPNKTGTGGVRMLPDGTGAESFTWRLPADTVGNRTSNTRPPPYTSLGATGCVKDTYACGPDDENGRGLFFAGTVGGQEWLGAMGTNTAGDLDYVYLTQDTGTQLDLRFVDLDGVPLGGQTKGVSSALFFKDRLYLGLPDTGGSRPYLAVVKHLPSTAPGFDAVAPADAEVLAADHMPGLGKNGSPANPAAMQMIDAMAAFNDALYVTNNGGCMRSTTPTPRRYDTNPGDWAPCTPSLAAWSSRVSRTTSKTADLEPEDKAVPQLAVFGGRLYLARNTTGGPQLFVCTPARGGDPAQCDPGDWSLVAPNSRGDTLLSQFDDANNTSLALLAATANHLYLGFDNAAEGLVLLRSEGMQPASMADFRGTGGCVASQLTSGCAGLGGNGLGAGATRLFSGEALTFGGQDFVYVIAGDGSNPVRVFRVAD